MPTFADSFWSGDYAGGLGVLFGKLQQGVVENGQILAIARMRAEAEEQYGRKMEDITPVTDKMSGGFARDDGASLRKAYEGVRGEMNEAARSHRKIASNISELVLVPFGRWCAAHESRVQNSYDDLQTRVRAHDKQADAVRKLRSAYFNKCRQVEDLEEEGKLGFQDPEKDPATPKSATTPVFKLSSADEQEDQDPIEIGDQTYSPDMLKTLLTNMLTTIPIVETKVPILGTYQNVSTGAAIVEFAQQFMEARTVSYAERIGQDLVDGGLLRLVGNVGNTFANSSKMHYQWRPRVFSLTGIPPRKKLERVNSGASDAGSRDGSEVIGSMGEMLSTWNPLNNPHPNETPMEKMQRESRETDERYKAGVVKLDGLRCNLEEAIVDHLKFMERCELDRLKAIKAVLLDFSGAISNVIPSLQSTVDNMMLYQETVQPLGDLRYLLDNYRTGGFFPKVTTYDNYYNHVDEQTFGVDLEARARQDRKRVPVVVTTILTFLDNHYPDLEGDEARRGIWLVDVPLAATHHLRNAINNGKAPPREVLERYEIPIVASALKLYLLELPDSLVSSQVYEIVKTVYSSSDASVTDAARVSVLQNTLGQLRLANIATLDAITTHFTRLIDLTSADEAYISSLAQALAPSVLRPRQQSSLTMQERHAYRLVRDLFDHKEEIFGELKRASSNSASGVVGANVSQSAAACGRTPSSTDERDRRANVEARQRAIASRSRAPSPTPLNLHGTEKSNGSAAANGALGTPRIHHRRERSTGAAETRFPIATGPSPAGSGHRGHRHNSLDVPDSQPNTPRAAETTSTTTSASKGDDHDSPSAAATAAAMASAMNGVPDEYGGSDSMAFDSSSTTAAAPSSAEAVDSTGVAKKNSLTRSGHVHSASGRLSRKNVGSGSGSSFSGGGLERGYRGSGTSGAGRPESQSSVALTESSRHSLEHDRDEGRLHGVELSDRPMDD